MAQRFQDEQTHVTLHETDSVLRDVDDVLATRPQQEQHGSKMDHANQVAKKTAEEMQQLCEGVNNRINELGIKIAGSQAFQGPQEKGLHFLGDTLGISWAQKKAAVLRHDRIQNISFADAIQELKLYVKSVIAQLGTTETNYRVSEKAYGQKIDEMLAKLKEATPKYIDVQARRAKLEGKVANLTEELASGTLDQSERPQKQKVLEETQRLLDGTNEEETTLAEIVQKSQAILPEVQKSRKAAALSIQTIHAMRQGMLEKIDDMAATLEHATTAMKARVTAEMYKSIDPALNKAFENITENDVATAGGLLETCTDRLKHPSIDPEVSQRLRDELLGHINDAAQSMSEIEATLKGGTGRPQLPNGHDTTDSEGN
jgi:hypothetical protein